MERRRSLVCPLKGVMELYGPQQGLCVSGVWQPCGQPARCGCLLKGLLKKGPLLKILRLASPPPRDSKPEHHKDPDTYGQHPEESHRTAKSLKFKIRKKPQAICLAQPHQFAERNWVQKSQGPFPRSHVTSSRFSTCTLSSGLRVQSSPLWDGSRFTSLVCKQMFIKGPLYAGAMWHPGDTTESEADTGPCPLGQCLFNQRAHGNCPSSDMCCDREGEGTLAAMVEGER